MLQSILYHPPWILLPGMVLALLPLVWSRLRAPLAPRVWALGLCTMPLNLALAELVYAFRVLPPNRADLKLDPRFFAIGHAGEALFAGALLMVVVLALHLALAPDSRRLVLALIPGILGSFALEMVLQAQLSTLVLLPPEQKVESWVLGEPTRLGVILGTVLVAGAVAVRSERIEARALALAGALPALCWPAWLCWWMLAGELRG